MPSQRREEQMEKKRRNGLSRLAHAARYSYRGLCAAWRNETAFRQEIAVICVAIPIAFWLGTTAAQRALLLLSALLILVVELINSAIEATVDRIGAERHPLSGRAKNLGSAAISAIITAAVAVWACIAWERWRG